MTTQGATTMTAPTSTTARICYHADESYTLPMQGPGYDTVYVVIKVTEDTPGYFEWASYSHLLDAKAEAKRLNNGLGLSENEVLDIRASSMAAGRVNNDPSQEDLDLVRSQLRAAHEAIAELHTRLERTQQDFRSERAAHDTAEADLANFKTKVRTVAVRYAEEYGWCNTVSDALDELGLPGVQREWTATVRVVGYLTIGVQATNESDAKLEAEGAVNNAEGSSRVHGLSLDVHEVQVETAELAT